MSINKLHSGAIQIQAMVNNGWQEWLETRTYYGIPKRQAVSQFRNTMATLGWWITD